MLKRCFIAMTALAVLAGFSACKKDQGGAGTDQITIKVFSNLPDRRNGQGLIEQTLFDMYTQANPGIKIEIEALDDEAYKTKFKAYAAGSSMPDLVNCWGQPSFINEVIDAGLLAELNPADYADYGFLRGSLDGWSKNGRLYGLARNTDVICFYYNEKLFKDNGWSVPQTYDELLALGKAVKAKGLIPVAMDGGDKWPLAIYLTDLITKLNGQNTNALVVKAIDTDWSDPVLTRAAGILYDTAGAGLFQNGFENADYGTAMNMFTSGQSAMFYMGSWEMSMANNADFSQEFRDNLRVFLMPVISGGNGRVTDICAWNGGGYAVTAKSAVKDEAVKLLNFMFRPENWNRLAWENNVCMSAQNFSVYQTGGETPAQKQLVEYVAAATAISGTTLNDLGNSEFKTRSEDLIQQLAVQAITPAVFIQRMD
ncbi:MAG: extracellular solute-binding protein [Treponema sp.]|jgi:raffinose/stachyose/melibiose transport system substrate-binding protein|nr:extracellular solute-binding protein [Treponema sp.]